MKRIINTDLVFGENTARISCNRLRFFLAFLIGSLTPAAYLKEQVLFDAASSGSATGGATVTLS
ncbi:MAG: hypothetical protein ACR2K1_00925, partial [Saprospiraceae bacterium]